MSTQLVYSHNGTALIHAESDSVPTSGDVAYIDGILYVIAKTVWAEGPSDRYVECILLTEAEVRAATAVESKEGPALGSEYKPAGW